MPSQEGAERMASKPWGNCGHKHAGTALRLMSPWLGAALRDGLNLHLHGDSAFASVIACLLLREYKIHFTGIVKQAHKQFPKAQMTQVQASFHY